MGKILEELDVAHQGVKQTKRRAKETVYWSNIDKGIAAIASDCEACKQHLLNKPKEEMPEEE